MRGRLFPSGAQLTRCLGVLCSADSLYCYETVPVGYRTDVPVHSPAPAPKDAFVVLRGILMKIPTVGEGRIQQLQSEELKDALTKALRALCDLFRMRHGRLPVLPTCMSYFDYVMMLLKITFFKDGNRMTVRTSKMYLGAFEFWKVVMDICNSFVGGDVDSWDAVPFSLTEECLGRFIRSIPVFINWCEVADKEACEELQSALKATGSGSYRPFSSGFVFKNGVFEGSAAGGSAAGGSATEDSMTDGSAVAPLAKDNVRVIVHFPDNAASGRPVGVQDLFHFIRQVKRRLDDSNGESSTPFTAAVTVRRFQDETQTVVTQRLKEAILNIHDSTSLYAEDDVCVTARNRSLHLASLLLRAYHDEDLSAENQEAMLIDVLHEGGRMPSSALLRGL